VHRAFWHKVWQTTLTEDVFRYQYECKYYYGLDPDGDDGVRGPTRMQDDTRELHTQTGRLEASMRLGLRGLNPMLPRLDAELVALGEPELTALRTRSFAARFDTAARYGARFGGRSGTSVALWVYPELKPASVRLKRCAEVDPSGRVVALMSPTHETTRSEATSWQPPSRRRITTVPGGERLVGCAPMRRSWQPASSVCWP
jgi:hypothetical protein